MSSACPNPETIIASNLTTYAGTFNLGFYNACQNQTHKIALSIQTFDKYKAGETFNDEQRKCLFSGVERSGHLHSIMPAHLFGTGVFAYDYKDPHAPRLMPGYFLSELSSSGAKTEGIRRLYTSVRNGTLSMLTTSDKTSPAAEIVIGQKDGVSIDWDSVDERYPQGSSNELEGFRPGKNFKSDIDFKKVYPWVENTEDLVMKLPSRKECLGGLPESYGVGLAGNLTECFGDWLNKLEVITYQNCKNDLDEKNVIREFNRLLDESARELRGSFSCAMNQKDKLVTVCEDTVDKDYVFFVGNGEDSGNKSKASQMRGEHAKMKNVIHIDSRNEPYIKTLVEAFSDNYIKNNVRAVVLSESLRTSSKPLAEYLQSKGVVTYGITANGDDELVRQQPDRWVVIPNQTVHQLESRAIPKENLRDPNKPPKAHVSSFQFCSLPVMECVTSCWIVENNPEGVYTRHKVGE